jgi:hypothetical protein
MSSYTKHNYYVAPCSTVAFTHFGLIPIWSDAVVLYGATQKLCFV